MPKLPVVSGADVVRALERLGFAVARQRGSHIVMRRGSAGCVVPNHRELKIGTLVFLQKNSSSHFMPNMYFEGSAPSPKTSLAVSAPLKLYVLPTADGVLTGLKGAVPAQRMMEGTDEWSAKYG